MLQLRECHAGREGPKLIISNGSERGDYVDCRELQNNFLSPHDGIQIMKTYYPSDEKWNSKGKISRMQPKLGSDYAWDHDYDDYWPLDFGTGKNEALRQLKDVKAIGADIHLTLTLDMSLSDEELATLFKQLRNLGRVYLRINHEANGAWFRHNRLHTYQEVGDFFVRCHNITKKVASNVMSVFSLSADVFVGDQINSVVTKTGAKLRDRELRGALAIADYWSIDKYVSLNWGWPHTQPHSSDRFFSGTADTWWRLIEETYLLMIHENGGRMKPLFIHEFNDDSDVVGASQQASTVRTVYERLTKGDFPWLEGICFYQFCDEAGLGLLRGKEGSYDETESLSVYKDVLMHAAPKIHVVEDPWPNGDYAFAWTDSTNVKGICVDGIAVDSTFENLFDTPVFVVQNDRWNFVNSGEKVPVMPASAFIFMPPADKNGTLRYVTTIKEIHSSVAAMFKNMSL